MNNAKKIKICHSEKVNLEEKTKPSPRLTLVDSTLEKRDIENFKKLISEKIKDPKMAKKAALILAEMLQKK